MGWESVLNVNDNGDISGICEQVHVSVYYMCIRLDHVQFTSHCALP